MEPSSVVRGRSLRYGRRKAGGDRAQSERTYRLSRCDSPRPEDAIKSPWAWACAQEASGVRAAPANTKSGTRPAERVAASVVKREVKRGFYWDSLAV